MGKFHSKSTPLITVLSFIIFSLVLIILPKSGTFRGIAILEKVDVKSASPISRLAIFLDSSDISWGELSIKALL